MKDNEQTIAIIKEKFEQIKALLNERSLRIWFAAEAKTLGRGVKALVHQATGVSWPTISKGLLELNNATPLDKNKIRHQGGGRKKLSHQDATLLDDLDKLVSPTTRGNPENPLRWTTKSTHKLAQQLRLEGHQVSQRSVYRLLTKQNFSLQANRKKNEGKESHPDRDAQFEHINQQTMTLQEKGSPVLSVDAKKKENIGLYKNNGREWHPKGEPTDVNTYDFCDKKKWESCSIWYF